MTPVLRSEKRALFGRLIESWSARAKQWLYPYRPRLRDWRFWTVQGLVLIVAGTHFTAELLAEHGHPIFLGNDPRVSLASFITVSLFYIPVVYAALNFGFAGSVATAVWCTFLTIPNFVIFHHGMPLVREAFQVAIVDAIAVFVGLRVEREMAARKGAEDTGAALQASELKYRGLFESSPVPVLLLDPDGAVLEANPAAGVLFSTSPDQLRSATVADLMGTAVARRLLQGPDDGAGQWGYLTLSGKAGTELYIQPTVTRSRDGQDRPISQVLLRDVTEERHRQAGLKAYAAHMLRAQEEERKRIAQELHDETVQEMILLCRQLDSVEAVANRTPAAVLTGLQEVRESAEHIVSDLRSFARGLRPPILEDLGLVTSVRRLLMDMTERTRIAARLQVNGEERSLPSDTALCLYRVAQEALRNVERHAHARSVAVRITFNDREYAMEVTDDGVGFLTHHDPSYFAAKGRLGLLGMQERAELLNGSLRIESTPGKGTKVSARVPTPPLEQAAPHRTAFS